MAKAPAERMSLGEVRHHVRLLLAEVEARSFTLLLDPDAATSRVPRPLLPGKPPSPERFWLALFALGLEAVVVFAAALAGGSLPPGL